MTGAWQPPAALQPRDRYTQIYQRLPGRDGCWEQAAVTISDALAGTAIATYTRNYPGTPPFEPFRQRQLDGSYHDYALISPHYQQTSAVDLRTGEIIASDDRGAGDPGFCPAGFYVPDWHDVHDGSVIPGSCFWRPSDEWPVGGFGFVWGCCWGDDNGWKVQYLDLSLISAGIITRDDRFGYVHLSVPPGAHPRDFIQVAPAGAASEQPAVTLSVPRRYRLTGELTSDGTG